MMRHLGKQMRIVVGDVTGVTYLFGASEVTLGVDGRDVDALLAQGGFVLA
jgi:hypothetical protein